MDQQYGSDFITIEDIDGVEYELMVLNRLEYNGASYIATMPASEDLEPEILIFRVEEDSEDSMLCLIEDEQELETVTELFDEIFFAEDDVE